MPAVPLGEAGPLLERVTPRVLFSDVDGTLVGHGGSLLSDLEGRPTLEAARALVAARQAGLDVVLMSGRTRPQLAEACRLLGLRDAIAELGTVLVLGRDAELLWGDCPRGLGPTPAAALERSGALALALERFAGRLEPHSPWHHDRQGTALLRGQVDPGEVDAALRDAGLGWARLRDNGRLRGDHPHLGPGATHTYHLLPAGVTKATTAAAYLERRGLRAEHAAAIGDGPADLELATTVGVTFLVANGAWAAAESPTTAVTTPSPAGQGWAEAVNSLIDSGGSSEHSSPPKAPPSGT